MVHLAFLLLLVTALFGCSDAQLTARQVTFISSNSQDSNVDILGSASPQGEENLLLVLGSTLMSMNSSQGFETVLPAVGYAPYNSLPPKKYVINGRTLWSGSSGSLPGWWVTDGTTNGTFVLINGDTTPNASPAWDDGAVIVGWVAGAQCQWWSSDGTPAGTHRFASLTCCPGSHFVFNDTIMYYCNNNIYRLRKDGSHGQVYSSASYLYKANNDIALIHDGGYLYRYDPYANNPAVQYMSGSSFEAGPNIGNKIFMEFWPNYFSPDQRVLLVTDGFTSQELGSICPEEVSGPPTTQFDAVLSTDSYTYFFSNNVTTSFWKSDGITLELIGAYPELCLSYSLNVLGITEFEGSLFFMFCRVGDDREGLFRIDTAGELHYLGPGAMYDYQPIFQVIDSTLYISSGELFKYDSATQSISLVKDFNLAPISQYPPYSITAFPGAGPAAVFFIQSDESYSTHLYLTDGSGTEEGTVAVSNNGASEVYADGDNSALFTNSQQMWAINKARNGSTLIGTPGYLDGECFSSGLFYAIIDDTLMAVNTDSEEIITVFDVPNSKLTIPSFDTGDWFLFGTNINSRIQLWRTDGTANNTEVVANITHNTPYSYFAIHFQLRSSDGLVYFSAPQDGSPPRRSIWKTNGTLEGTEVVVRDIGFGVDDFHYSAVEAAGKIYYNVPDALIVLDNSTGTWDNDTQSIDNSTAGYTVLYAFDSIWVQDHPMVRTGDVFYCWRQSYSGLNSYMLLRIDATTEDITLVSNGTVPYSFEWSPTVYNCKLYWWVEDVLWVTNGYSVEPIDISTFGDNFTLAENSITATQEFLYVAADNTTLGYWNVWALKDESTATCEPDSTTGSPTSTTTSPTSTTTSTTQTTASSGSTATATESQAEESGTTLVKWNGVAALLACLALLVRA